ncbi:protein DENND6A isoform X3 [Artibeus jamaicensis]|uniref:protein DENND6A isoform X3 n=1 Tax=Artibeus jamaicensis TaxID=9417 RepID=UPI00235A9160|nr:protein DENND6A isoform X3 [Artibeus jamaicensis]
MESGLRGCGSGGCACVEPSAVAATAVVGALTAKRHEQQVTGGWLCGTWQAWAPAHAGRWGRPRRRRRSERRGPWRRREPRRRKMKRTTAEAGACYVGMASRPGCTACVWWASIWSWAKPWRNASGLGAKMPGLELWREKTSSREASPGCLGDTQFCFRFRQSSGRRVSLHCFLDQFDKDLPVYLKKDPAYFYGYVYFRQVRDKTLKRGYFQKIAPEYFEKSKPYLEAACNDVDRWPAPVPGKTLYLPIMGVVMKVRIPTCHDKPGTTQIAQLTQQILSRTQNLYCDCEDKGKADTQISVILPTVHEVDLFRCFCPVFLHSQMLWELVLLGEPLVVMAPSPSESSETVLALVNCISPLKYFSDFRPYFTIHDSEFKEYTTRTQAPPSVILGVTNPFFAKTLQHWPHIIRIGDLKPAGEIPKQVKVKKLKNLKTLDSKPGVYTSYKPYLNRDEEIIKQLQKGVQQKRPSEAQSVILRRYFLELTQSFIIPLERYVASLMPLQKCISPWKSPPQLRPFFPEEFMKTLEKTGPQLTSRIKGDWIGLYRHFLKSPNFDGWFKTRRKEMTQKLEALHLEALCEEDLLLWTQKHTEVETVDLVLKLKSKLLQADREHLPVKPETVEKLRTHIDAIILALPEDLQGILLKTGMT